MVNMEAKSVRITAALIGSLLVWLYVELKYERQIDYNNHNYLVNSTTGAHIEPRELLDAEKVLGAPIWYINGTNSLERLHDLEFSANLATGLEIDQGYSNERDLALSGWPVANRTKCAQQLDWIKSQLAGRENYGLIRGQLGRELSQMMDSFGKPEAGFYSGATAWPGAYEHCLKTSLNDNQIKTRYCWLRFRPTGWARHGPVRPQARVRVGVCLPEECDTAAFADQSNTIEWLAKLNLNEFFRQNLEADSMFCLPDERSPIRQMPLAGRLYRALIIVWVALVLICSLVYERLNRKRHAQEVLLPLKSTDQLGRTMKLGLALGSDQAPQAPSRERLHRLLRAMSIGNSLKSFKSNPFGKSIANSHQSPRLDLSCLNAVKFVMALMIVLGHSVYLATRFTHTHTQKIQMSTQTTGLIVMSIGRFVDTFFLLFGLLAAYTLLRRVPTDKLATPATWLVFNLGIMCRLMPLIVPLYYYNQLVSVYTSHGPWWDYGTYRWSLRGLCLNEPAWKVLPLFGFLGIQGVACMPVNWFLVVYSQLALAVPVLVFSLSKLPNYLARTALIAYICGISSLFIVVKMKGQRTFQEESFGFAGGLIVDLMEKFESLGAMASIGRAGSVAIGCYVGYLLRMYELENIQKWPKWLTSRATLVVVSSLHLILFLVPLIGSRITQFTQHRTNLNEFIAGFLGIGFLWTILNSVLIVMVTTRYQRSAIARFLGHSFWHSANKLGLAIFLVHFEVLYSTLLGHEQGPSLGLEPDIWKLIAYGITLSLPLAFVLHIMFEAPVNALVGLILQRNLCERRAETDQIEVAVYGQNSDSKGRE